MFQCRINRTYAVERATNGSCHRPDGVGIAPEVRAQNGAAVRIGLRQLNQSDGARHGFNGTGSGPYNLIQLLAGRLNAVSVTDNFQRQFKACTERCAKGSDPFLLRMPGNGWAAMSPAEAMAAWRELRGIDDDAKEQGATL